MKLSLSAIALAVLSARQQEVFAAEEEESSSCRLYLAPSQLSSEAMSKYGLYAGVDYKTKDEIPDIELGLPFIDFFIEPNKNSDFTRGILDYLENQMWTSDFASSKFEGNISTSPFFPGVGALGNYHSLISNVDWSLPSSLLREREDITAPGKPHLSRGAITNVYNVTMVATQAIPAGMEIFPNFGDMWDKDESNPYQDKVSRKDFVEADQVVDRIVEFYDKYGDQMSEQLKEDMLDFMLDKVLGTAGGMRAATIKGLIPENYKKIKDVKDIGGTYLYRNKNLLRTPKWFKKNGICVDNMRADKSTIVEAGRGAFATRKIAQDTVVSIIPTVLFGKKDLMKKYDILPGTNDGPLMFDKFKPLGQQIAVNYAFGHSESSFLLLPMAPAVSYINHNSEPNVKLQWSDHAVMHNDPATWDHTVEEVQNFKSNMVVFELVATKEINDGDEIFLDYGTDWVEAWDNYKTLWEAKYADQHWPLRAEDVKLTFKHHPFPTVSEEVSHLIPHGIRTACYIKSDNVPDGSPTSTPEGMDIWVWDGPVQYNDYAGALLTLCDIKERVSDGMNSYNYTVVTKMESDGEQFSAQVNNVPHVAVTVVDAPYTGDLHLKDAFRHPIGIPDDIFPQNWRDLR